MPAKRAGRLAYALFSLVLIGIIGRNVYQRSLNARLIAAVETRNVAAVRALLERGADPDSRTPVPARSSTGALALNLVMGTGTTATPDEEAIACLLIQHGASITKLNGGEYLPTACASGSIAIVRCLLEHGANPTLPDSSKRTPLNLAIDYSAPAPYLASAQQEATRQQRRPVSREMARLLCERGARVNMWQAALVDDTDSLRGNLDMGTPVDSPQPSPNFNGSYKGPTALTLAAQAGSTNAVLMLLEYGANINSVTDFPYTPLTGAIAGNQIEIARLLLNRGANVNIPATTSNSPLLVACASLPQLVPDLLRHGAKLGTWGDWALSAALQNKHPELVPPLLKEIERQGSKLGGGALKAALEFRPDLVPMLLARGAIAREAPIQPNSRMMGDSLLWYAIHFGRRDLIVPLLGAGANVNAHHEDTTPLVEALGQGAETVKLLLDRGADPNASVGAGQTPLILAAQTGNVEATRLLLEHGAKVDGEGSLRRTALYFARRHKQPAIVALLEQAGGHER